MKRCSLVLVALFGFVACGGGHDTTSSTDYTGGITTLQTEDLVVGAGATAAVGDTVSVNYTGTLINGTQFDTSIGKAPLSFRVGAGSLIAGFEQGVVGMRVGGKRRVTIPPSLAYGASGNGPIPPNATVRFEIDLVSIVGK